MRPPLHPRVVPTISGGEETKTFVNISTDKAVNLKNVLGVSKRNLPEGQRQREMLRCFKRLVPSYQPSVLGLGRYSDEETGAPRPEPEEVPLFN